MKAIDDARLVEFDERNAKVEECRFAIEEERLRIKAMKQMNKRQEHEQRVMFMDV